MNIEKFTGTAEKAVSQIESQFDIWVNNQLFNNDFLIASLFAALAAASLYLLRKVPYGIWIAIKKRCTILVEVGNTNQYYVDIAQELDRNSIKFLSRTKVLDKNTLTIGFSTSFSYFNGHFCIVNRVKEESDYSEVKQFINITFPFLSHKKVQDCFDSFISGIESKKEDKTVIYSVNKENRSISLVKEIPKRTRESVYVKESILKQLEDRITFFMNNRAWYEKTGIPYKYNILLYGPPGTGKTTLMKYISSFSNRDLVFTNPSALNKLANMLNARSNYYFDEEVEQTKKYVGVIEDIDCFNSTTSRNNSDSDTEKNDDGTVSHVSANLSDVLNVLDGLNSPDDFILVATTNHLESLDPALIRKGRFDSIFFIGFMEREEILKMFELYYGDNSEFMEVAKSRTYEPISGADMQDLILTNLNDPYEVLNSLKEK